MHWWTSKHKDTSDDMTCLFIKDEGNKLKLFSIFFGDVVCHTPL